MIFRTRPVNHAARVVAALLVTTFGLAFAAAGVPVIGLLILAAGLIVLAWAGWKAWREWHGHDDRYDLSRLWEDMPEEAPAPEEDDLEERGLVYCHHCGAAMPADFSMCPECGNRLRG